MEAVRQETPFLYKGENVCILCHEDIDNTYVVAHEDQDVATHLHPMHEDCRDNLLEFLGGPPYNCPMCRVPLAGNPIPPIRELYGPPIQVWYDYPKDKLPEKILSDLRQRKIEILKKNLLYGLTVDFLCLIAVSTFFFKTTPRLVSILPFDSETNKIIIDAFQMQFRFFPQRLILDHMLANQSYTKQPPLTFKLNREIAKAYKEDIRNLYITSFVLGMIINIGVYLYLTISIDQFIPALMVFSTTPIARPLFRYFSINFFPTKT